MLIPALWFIVQRVQAVREGQAYLDVDELMLWRTHKCNVAIACYYIYTLRAPNCEHDWNLWVVHVPKTQNSPMQRVHLRLSVPAVCEDIVSFGRTDWNFWRQVSWLHCTTSSRREAFVWDMVAAGGDDDGQNSCSNERTFQNNDPKWVNLWITGAVWFTMHLRPEQYADTVSQTSGLLWADANAS